MTKIIVAIAMLAASAFAAQANIVCVAAYGGGIVCFYQQGINDAQERASQTCGERFFDAGPC